MTRVAVIDADYIRHAVSSAGEKRSVLITHKSSGRSIELPTRTDWYGHWAKKDGGKLAEINEGRTSPFSWDEFTYEDIQRPEPIENVLHSARLMFENSYKQAGAKEYKAFFGRGISFRRDLSTIIEYKGNRKDMIVPVLMNEVSEYLIRKFKVEVVENIEADDRVVMECYGKKDHFVLGVDKDVLAQPVLSFNPNRPEEGIVNGNQFGKLYLNSKNEVKGIGRMFLYHQTCFGDLVDNYRANSASDMKWGEKSSYKALVDCKNDKEALEAVVGVYKKLYPEPKKIIGWRGDEIEVDWLYAMNENFQMARMLRSMDELTNPILVTDVLQKVGIEI